VLRLALALGMTVADLESRMTARELGEWMAYDRLEPIGEWRGDVRAGIIAATIANASRSKGKRAKPADFMPFLDDRPRMMSPDEFAAKVVPLMPKRST